MLENKGDELDDEVIELGTAKRMTADAICRQELRANATTNRVRG
jgi:hypothetical protein